MNDRYKYERWKLNRLNQMSNWELVWNLFENEIHYTYE